MGVVQKREENNMTDFEKAFHKTMTAEGGYVNDPNDAGGETYSGISRVYNPTWKGWDLIDDLKSKSDFPSNLGDSDEIQDAVFDFYEDKYWDVNRLDDVKSQAIAEEMFDTGTNLGVKRAAKFLQQSLNFLNRNGRLFPDLVVDSNIGPASLRALDKILDNGDEEILLIMMNVLQGKHYMDYMSKSPIQEKYARGWFKRVKLSKD